jgi:hypothetical protein
MAGDLKGSQFTATIETDAGRKSVELVQIFSRPLLTPVGKKLSLYFFSLWHDEAREF